MPLEEIELDEVLQQPFSERVIRNQAMGNALAITMVTAEFLEKQGISPEKWAMYAGERFASGWDEMRERSATDVMKLLVLNMVSLGAEPAEVTGDERHAEVRIAWPPAIEDDEMHIDQLPTEVQDSVWHVFRPIATRLAVDFDWHREDHDVVLSVNRSQ